MQNYQKATVVYAKKRIFLRQAVFS